MTAQSGIGLAVSTVIVALRDGGTGGTGALAHRQRDRQRASREQRGGHCNPSRLSGTRRGGRSAAAHRRARRLSRSPTGAVRSATAGRAPCPWLWGLPWPWGSPSPWPWGSPSPWPWGSPSPWNSRRGSAGRIRSPLSSPGNERLSPACSRPCRARLSPGTPVDDCRATPRLTCRASAAGRYSARSTTAAFPTQAVWRAPPAATSPRPCCSRWASTSMRPAPRRDKAGVCQQLRTISSGLHESLQSQRSFQGGCAEHLAFVLNC